MENSNKDQQILEQEALEEQTEKKSHLMELLIVAMLIVMLLIYFSDRFFMVIPAGHKGVYFSTLGNGTVLDGIYYDEGLLVKFPWDLVILYNTRIQEHQDTVIALTEDGLEVYVEISFRYYPDYLHLGRLHKEIGPDYLNTILVPQITAITRDVISLYDVEKLYSVSRDSIQSQMTVMSQHEITDNYPLSILDIVIRNIILPEKIMAAISKKLVWEQAVLEYDYRLMLESKEAQRKLIEARGIKAFTDTSQIDILKWEGISATKTLATSENAKVIVIGTDSGDLPIILGGNN